MPKQDIQLTLPENFNAKSLVFDQVQKRQIPDSEVSYYQANIKMRYPDGSEGPIIIQLPRCPTYGVSNKYGDSADKLSLSIIIGEKDNFSDEYKQAVKCLNDIVTACKTFTLTEEVKNKIGQYDLEERDLKDMSPLKFQRDKESKKLLSDKPPILNAKFACRNNKETKTKDIESKFYVEDEFDSNGCPVRIDPRECIGKSGYCTALIKIESIYYGTKTKLQCKIYECDIKSNDSGFRSLLHRPGMNKPMVKKQAVVEEDDDVAMDDYAEDEEQEEEAKPAIMQEDDDQEMSQPAAVEPVVVDPEPVKQPEAKKARRNQK